ncbi:MAG TPA: response regulator transcription factor [Gammaproteobacteria bacterium]|nr:response regulator transcription factor [Gammaproteobacteria bacterium]
MRLLLIEDDTDLASRLQRFLRQEGFAVDRCANGIDGEFQGREYPYDAIVLDLGLPDRPGLEVLANWRRDGIRTPVLILTARDTWQQKVEGLQQGADDYLTKPFHEAELLARLQALIRRSTDTLAPVLAVNGLELDEETQTVRRGDERWQLTATEFRLLRYFMRHPGRILSKSRLTEHVYEMDADRDSNVIEVYVNRLRRKLGNEIITTRRGQGYVFGELP